jgi:hypothetical protein
MRYNGIYDLILAADNLPDLEIVQREMEMAELEYSEAQWTKYAAELVKLHNGRRTVIAKQLLQAA